MDDRTSQKTAPAGTLWRPTFGATPVGRETTFRVWASAAESVALVVEDPGGAATRTVPLARRERMFEARVEDVGHGALYRYRLNGREVLPDPAARFQPEGVHGPSQVIDWTRFAWSDANWKGVPFEDLVIYELHVGAFTPQGSFVAVIDRLPHLGDLGITAIELMPIAAFPGRRNWGYDGAALYAPASQYGRPADLQRLVDAAHRAGIAVLLDVVYNHLGPDGAYLGAFSPDFFSSRHRSPWGDGVNLDGPGSDMVRRFLVENALHWIHEFHVDGLRLDATHALVDDSDRFFVAELSEAVHRAGADLARHVHVIAEDERNLAGIIRPQRARGDADGVWADDFHHEMHRLLTGDDAGYYADYSGETDGVVRAINRGWLYTGQQSRYTGHPRGTDPAGLPLSKFVFCLQNHDQVGNRAMGERLDQLSDPAACRAAAAVLLLAPETPLLFMGQEWAASTPFLYFTDHHEQLGRLVTEGRRREFRRFPAFSDPAARERIPDPQDDATFEASRLEWDETRREPHRLTLGLYRTLIDLRRRTQPRARIVSPATIARTVDSRTLAIVRDGAERSLLLVARFGEPGRSALRCPADVEGRWELAVTTEDAGFANDPAPPRVQADGDSIVIDFARPSAVIFRRR